MSDAPIESKIIKFLSKHPRGATIAEIARGIDAHRNTVSKYIFGMTGQGVIAQRQIGAAQMCYLKKKR